MKLRPKLALTLAAVVIPVMVVFTVFRLYAEQRAVQERMANRVAARVEARAGSRCVRAPERFHFRVRRGFEVYAYDSEFQPTNPRAPALRRAVVAALEDGQEIASARLWRHENYGGVTATRTDWSSDKCAVLAVYWPDRVMSRPGRVARTVVTEALVASVVLLITALVVAGPLVGRIRRLTAEIEDTDSSDYQLEAESGATDELGELARAFNRAGSRVRSTVEELEARDEALTEYIANTTHDLAIPLTVLQHRIRRLQRQLADDPDSRELVDAAMQEAHYIAALIANMAAAARLEGRGEKLTLHTCSLGEIVERVISRHRPIAEQADIELNWATPADETPVECDSTLVEQALSNFVQNAIQYNSPGDETGGGHVSVVLDQDDAGFELRVIDDGPGVPEDILEEVTQRDFRVEEARTRRPEGQGFGLSIARRICELHGWELRLDNRPEGGLEVVVCGG